MLKNVQRLQQMSFYTEGGLQGCNAMCFVCGYQYFGVMLSSPSSGRNAGNQLQSHIPSQPKDNHQHLDRHKNLKSQ
jgi:hypothetical protein